MSNNVTDLGKVGITMKGTWSSSTSYERLDGVMYDGSLWIALADNSNSTPSELNSNWMLAAKHGEFTEQQLEEFKAEVIAESKEEIDDYTDDKKDELDTYTGTKKSELDTYEGTKESELNTYAGGLKDTFDSNASSKTTAFNNNASDKTTAFNSNASDKTSTFNSNASSKTGDFDTNATSKTTTFNDNATSKTTDFNTNATNKTTAFDSNATSKTTAFNQNATAKTAEFDANAQEIQNEIDDIEELIETELTSASTEESTRADINDSAKWFGGLKVIGNTEQAQYEGNQLIDFTNATAGANVSTSFENDIFTVTSSTGSYRSCYFIITDLYKANAGKTLKFVYDSINASVEEGNKVQINVRKTNDTTQYISLVSSTYINYPHTIPNDISDVAAVQLVVYANNTNSSVENASITITKPMLQFGTENKNYEPFVGRNTKPKSRLSTRN